MMIRSIVDQISGLMSEKQTIGFVGFDLRHFKRLSLMLVWGEMKGLEGLDKVLTGEYNLDYAR